jgi:hypothetical protein
MEQVRARIAEKLVPDIETIFCSPKLIGAGCVGDVSCDMPSQPVKVAAWGTEACAASGTKKAVANYM